MVGTGRPRDVTDEPPRTTHGANHEIGDDVTQIDDSRYQHRQPTAAVHLIPPPRPSGEMEWHPDPSGPVLEPEPAPTRLTNGTASVALVMSLLWLLGVGALLGLVLGVVAARQCHRTGESGRGVAVAAIVLGVLGLVVSPVALPYL